LHAYDIEIGVGKMPVLFALLCDKTHSRSDARTLRGCRSHWKTPQCGREGLP